MHKQFTQITLWSGYLAIFFGLIGFITLKDVFMLIAFICLTVMIITLIFVWKVME